MCKDPYNVSVETEAIDPNLKVAVMVAAEARKAIYPDVDLDMNVDAAGMEESEKKGLVSMLQASLNEIRDLLCDVARNLVVPSLSWLKTMMTMEKAIERIIIMEFNALQDNAINTVINMMSEMKKATRV